MKHYTFLNLATLNAPYAEEMKAAVGRVIDSGRYIGGQEVAAFEEELAAYVGTEYAVGVSNGLDALRLIIKAYMLTGKLKEGDTIVLPSETYIASALAVTDNRLKVLALSSHSDAAGCPKMPSNLDDVKAVMPVHLYGRTCWTDEFDAMKRRGVIFIEDNAQAIGATTADGLRTGALGNAAAISFYPTKNLGAVGDAGAVTTDDAEIAAIVRALANYGSDRRYHNIYQGYNCRLDPVQAAMLRVKLRHLDDENARRQSVASAYCSAIENPLVVLPRNDGRSVWHQFVVKIADGRRDAFRQYLADNGVETDVHYPLPFYEQPCYRGSVKPYGEMIEVDETTRAATSDFCGSIVSLPIAHTSAADALEISEIINNYHR